VLLCAAALASFSGAAAGPWAEVGDAGLRNDIEILAAAGVIDNITMQWPLPWSTILARLNRAEALADLPPYVRAAARRVAARARRDVHMHRPRVGLLMDGTNNPAVVRGFSALTIDKAQAQLSYEYVTTQSAIRVSLGTQTGGADRQGLMFDDSYAATLVGPAIVYAGYKSHWWGPGWISSMSLSNNARPLPQVGVSRASTTASKSPWLSWLGPWQYEFFVALMDGPRTDKNTILIGTRAAFSPIDHLEIGISRLTEICGLHHTCHPLWDYFNPNNNNTHVNNTNDELSFDFKYSRAYANWGYEIYAQLMNEDNNPIVNSGTSKLAGGSVWLPLHNGNGRITVEYADSRATKNIWGGGYETGFAYNNGMYLDGMRYRGRTLAFSLDSDSRLFSVQAAFTDNQARSLTLSYHRAQISTPALAARVGTQWVNTVSSAPVTIDILETRLSLPFEWNRIDAQFDLTARLQDDQPRPRKGATAAFELSLGMWL
jgi:hypothetical protein